MTRSCLRVLALGLLLTACVAPAATDDPAALRKTACNGAEDVVNSRLRAPATARHQPCSDREVRQLGTKWSISGWVDSENGFGALVRTEYVVTIEDKGETWGLIDIQFIEP